LRGRWPGVGSDDSFYIRYDPCFYNGIAGWPAGLWLENGVFLPDKHVHYLDSLTGFLS